MSTPCDVVQVLEPLTDVLVGNEGSMDQSLQENGTVSLAIGQQEVMVNFATNKISNDYEFSALYVENLVDLPPMDIEPTLVARSQGGFTVELNGAPNTVNYTLVWRVRVRSGGGTSAPTPAPPSTDPLESIYAPLTLGASQQTFNFSVARSTLNYGFSELRVENLVDGPGQTTLWIQVIAKTLNGFTIDINPPPDTSNYNLVARSP